MDFNDTPDEAKFRAEARGWLDAQRGAPRARRAPRNPDGRRGTQGPAGARPRLAAHQGRRGLGLHHLARRVRRPRRHGDPERDLGPGGVFEHRGGTTGSSSSVGDRLIAAPRKRPNAFPRHLQASPRIGRFEDAQFPASDRRAGRRAGRPRRADGARLEPDARSSRREDRRDPDRPRPARAQHVLRANAAPRRRRRSAGARELRGSRLRGRLPDAPRATTAGTTSASSSAPPTAACARSAATFEWAP